MVTGERGLSPERGLGSWEGVGVDGGIRGLSSIEHLLRGGGGCHRAKSGVPGLAERLPWWPTPLPGPGNGCSVGLSSGALAAGLLSETFCPCLGNLLVVGTQHVRDAMGVVPKLAGVLWRMG